jgi:hypothetical protein
MLNASTSMMRLARHRGAVKEQWSCEALCKDEEKECQVGVKFPGRWRSLLSGAMHTRNWGWHMVNLGCPLPVSNKFQCIGNDVSDI